LNVSPKVFLRRINEFAVLFDAIRLSNPSQVQYRYKLDGYDKDWTIVSVTKRCIDICRRQYRFLVSARDAGSLGATQPRK